MNITIIAICGRASEGKSETIKKVCEIILRDYPNAVPSILPYYSHDILLTIQLNKVKIGIESKEDPNSRIISEDTINSLANIEEKDILGGCDIIICATRTGGMTGRKVDEIADKYAFHTV